MIEKPRRLHVIVEEELQKEWNATIAWGLRQHLIIAIMKMICAAVHRDGNMLIGAILAGKVKLVIDNDA